MPEEKPIESELVAAQLGGTAVLGIHMNHLLFNLP